MAGPPPLRRDERSLGDILGDALRADAIPKEPDGPPFDAVAFVLGHLSSVIAPQPSPPLDDKLLVMDWLARVAAEALNVPHETALMCLYAIPENMEGLLESPEGWTALIEYVAQGADAHSTPHRPTIH